MTYIQETNNIQGNQHILIGVFSFVTGEEMEHTDPLKKVLNEPKYRKSCGELTVTTRVTMIRDWIDDVLTDGAVFCVHGKNAG